MLAMTARHYLCADSSLLPLRGAIGGHTLVPKGQIPSILPFTLRMGTSFVYARPPAHVSLTGRQPVGPSSLGYRMGHRHQLSHPRRRCELLSGIDLLSDVYIRW